MMNPDQHLALLMVIADQRIQIVNLSHELEEAKKMISPPPVEPPNGTSPVPTSVVGE